MSDGNLVTVSSARTDETDSSVPADSIIVSAGYRPDTDVMPLRSYWERHGGRLVVAFVATVAVLSVATGIADIGTRNVVGPFGRFVPAWLQRTAGFTGTLTRFLLVISAFGLRRGLRVAWYAAAVLLPMTALQGLLQSSPVSVPLVVLSAVALPALLANAGRFDRSLSVSTSQLAAGAALVATQVYSVGRNC